MTARRVVDRLILSLAVALILLGLGISHALPVPRWGGPPPVTLQDAP